MLTETERPIAPFGREERTLVAGLAENVAELWLELTSHGLVAATSGEAHTERAARIALALRALGDVPTEAERSERMVLTLQSLGDMPSDED